MRLLHTMLRVSDLEKSIQFYCDIFQMQLLRKKDYPNGRFTLAFLGYGDESENTVLELTHNWDKNAYDLGDGFGHIAIGVENIYSICDHVKRLGAKVVREAGPMKHADKASASIIAFVEDPDGYKIELIERC